MKIKMAKSSRHSKITGDFAEALVLYWLSKQGFECARLDHTGIDLIARNPHSRDRMGISVKSRSRYAGTENVSVNLPSESFVKARKACQDFGCKPYFAIVVDAGDSVRCFILSLSRLKNIVGTGAGMKYWPMSPRHLARYHADPKIIKFELRAGDVSWQA
jgi:hypothetical protein